MSTCHRRSNSSQSSTNKPNILTSPLSHKKTSSSIQFIQKALNPLSIPSHRLPFKKPPKVVLLFLLLVALLTFLLTNSTPTQTKKYTKPTSTPNVTDISTLHLFPPSVIAEYLPYYFNNSLYHEYIDENNNTQGIPTVISTSIGYSLSTFHLKKTWPEVRYFNQALLMVMSQQNGTLQKSILPDGSIVPLNNESVCSSTVSAVEIMRELLLPVPSKTNAFIEKCSSGCIQNKCAATCTQCTLLTYLKYVSGYISYEKSIIHVVGDEVVPQVQTLESKDIPILYITAKTTIEQPITILYNHDANETLGSIRTWLSILAEIFKANIMKKTAQHMKYVWNFLTKKLGQRPNRIILYGKGAGCGPVLYLAHKLQKKSTKDKEHPFDRAAGIILVNAIVETNSLCFSCVSLAQVKKITSPVILVSSTACTNRQALLTLANSFQFTRGIHFLKSATLDFEDECLEEMCIRLNKFIITLFPEYKDVFSGEELLKRKPVEMYLDPIDAIRNFLQRHKLGHLTENMVSFGYLSIDDLLTMDQIDIDGFGFDEDVGKKLLDAINKEKESLGHINKSLDSVGDTTQPQPNSEQSYDDVITRSNLSNDRKLPPPIIITTTPQPSSMIGSQLNNYNSQDNAPDNEVESQQNTKSDTSPNYDYHRQSLPNFRDTPIQVKDLCEQSHPINAQLPPPVSQSIKELSHRQSNSRKPIRLDQTSIKELSRMNELEINIQIENEEINNVRFKRSNETISKRSFSTGTTTVTDTPETSFLLPGFTISKRDNRSMSTSQPPSQQS
ncbi:SAM domain-containing protein [Entamoeba marina]